MKPRLEKIVEDNKTTEIKVFFRNSLLFLIPFILCSVIVFLLIFFDVWYINTGTEFARYIILPVSTGLVLGVIFWVTFPKTTIRKIEPIEMWVNKDSHIVFYPQTRYKIPSDVFKKEFKNVCSISLNSRASLTIDISFLREAEEVRKLLCSVEIKWNGSGGDMQRFLDEEKEIIKMGLLFEKQIQYDSPQEIDVLTPFLYYHLPEMKNQKGKELAKLYNPSSAEQQELYRTIIRDYFDSLGYRLVINGSFALPGEIYTPW